MGIKKTISPDNRNKMFAMGVETYSSYALLDMVSSNYYVSKNKDFDINGNKISLRDYITSLVKEAKTEADFTLGKLACHIKLLPLPNNEWSISITSPSIQEQKEPLDLKPIQQLQPEDFIQMCAKYPLVISQEKTGGYKFSAELNTGGKKLRLGGPGKIGLFQLHISNLYTMLQRVKDPYTDLNMLVAMATGSGKSYTQALWFLVQYLVDNPCYFAAPSATLVAQLKSEFEKLLPDTVTNDITVLDENAAAATPDKPGSKWVMMSHKKLLLDHWDFLQDKTTQRSNLLICIDEEHLAADEELWNKRIKILAERYPIMLLSATPSEEAYGVTGGDPVASLSRKEKEAQGIAKSVLSTHAHPQGILKQGGKKAKLSLKERLILRFVGVIAEERMSTAHEYMDQSETAVFYRPVSDPFYAKPDPKTLRRFMRWNIETAISKKALVLTDRHDPVINLSLISQKDLQNPYKNGNRILRDGVYDFFQLGPDLDNRCFKEYKKAKVDLRRETFLKPLQNEFTSTPLDELNSAVEQHIDLGDSSQYLKYRVFHGLIESSLQYLLGYDSNQLDYMRFHHFDQLIKEVKFKLTKLPQTLGGVLNGDHTAYEIFLMLQEKDKLPQGIAGETARAMVDVLEKLSSCNDKACELIVDNWSVDKQLHELFNVQIEDEDWIWRNQTPIISYIHKHKTVFLVNGLEKSPTPIASNCPFFKLTEHRPRLGDDIVKNNPALRHPLSTLEAMDDRIFQAVYTPDYCPDEYTPEVVKALFRTNRIGGLFTSENVTGYNDLGLQHVGMLIDDMDDPMNATSNIIQGKGRNRAQKPSEQPFDFVITAPNTKIGMPSEALEKKNYYPDFFKAKKLYHQDMTKRLGTKIATQMKTYLDNNVNPDGTIETNDLQKELHDIIISEFEQIYKNNNFDFKKTKKIFSSVLIDVYSSLYAQSSQLKRQYGMPLTAKIMATVLYVIATIYYKLAIAGSYFSFFWASRKLVKAAKTDKSLLNEATYTHIVRSFNFKDLITVGAGAKRFNDLMKADFKKTIEFALKKEPFKHVKHEDKQLFIDFFKKDLSARFVRFMGNSLEQQVLLAMITNKNQWFEKAYPDIAILLEKDKQDAVEKFFTIIQTDPEIATYITQQRLQVAPDREHKAAAGIKHIADEIQNILMKVQQSNDILQLQEDIKNILINNLDHLSFYLHPKDAACLSQNKDQLQIDPGNLANLFFHGVPAAEQLSKNITELFRASLPPKVSASFSSDSDIEASSHRWAQVNDITAYPNDHLDMDSIRDSLVKPMERYIKSPMLKKIVNMVLNPFSEKQLFTLLRAIYPGKNQDIWRQLDKIINFKKDLSKLSTQEFMEKYASFDDPKQLAHSDLNTILSWIFELYNEILTCECYWHDMDKKAGVGYEHEPRLKTKDNKLHDIWNKHGTSSTSTLTTIAKKALYVRATQNSFSGLNEVETIGHQPTINILKETADCYVSPLRKSLDASYFFRTEKSSLHRQSMFKQARALGEKMRAAKSLTEGEINSSATKDLNAVQRLQRPRPVKG